MKGLGRYIWILLILVVVGGAGVLGIALWNLWRHPPQPDAALPTAILWTTTPTPISTATPRPTATPRLPTPTPPVVSGLGVGSRVLVTGTGAAGLNLRDAPGLQGARVDIAAEGEVFIIAGGPVEADELTWWLLKDEANPDREGWGAANYLTAP